MKKLPELGACAILLFFGLFFYLTEKKNAAQWNEIRSKSADHAVITNTYLDCLKTPKSRSECQLHVVDYGHMIGIENPEKIIENIIELESNLD